MLPYPPGTTHHDATPGASPITARMRFLRGGTRSAGVFQTRMFMCLASKWTFPVGNLVRLGRGSRLPVFEGGPLLRQRQEHVPDLP